VNDDFEWRCLSCPIVHAVAPAARNNKNTQKSSTLLSLSLHLPAEETVDTATAAAVAGRLPGSIIRALSSTNHHIVVLLLHIHILSLSLASLPCITPVQLKVVEAEGDDGSGWDRGHAGEPSVDEYGEQGESTSRAVEQEKKQEQEQVQGNDGTLSGGGSGKDRALSEPPTANIAVIAALLRQVGELEAQVETERKRGIASAEMAERLARQLDHVTAVRVLCVLCVLCVRCVLCVLCVLL
jgi:hypothetical protein